MGKYYVSTNGSESWKALLANPEKQWKAGYSAYELAHCWEGARNLPSCVERVFKQCQIPVFHDVEILYAFPEYKVALPGGGAGSQNDLYLMAKSGDELLTIMVEGKVSEPFGETVEAWLGVRPSDGKKKRLEFLLNLLNLEEKTIKNKRYQLLHRTASALLEARKVNANHALMLVHSFSETGEWFEDYRDFVKLFELSAKKNEIVGPILLDGIHVYFAWVTGEKQK
ncbi:DUF6946 family protein [Robertmurraya andreesenii]|uniref:DUF6946 domain-containing protein n=1 Tax=Anoxybacillus andreesenii TaxID=1325932 RepID=A0ABT9V1E2_9BACL|nr:hypothetical protein [Robertmurraya andreesenii]MDQ0154695.1 hypothetical protein [Robertmurraya andreesenii]